MELAIPEWDFPGWRDGQSHALKPRLQEKHEGQQTGGADCSHGLDLTQGGMDLAIPVENTQNGQPHASI